MYKNLSVWEMCIIYRSVIFVSTGIVFVREKDKWLGFFHLYSSVCIAKFSSQGLASGLVLLSPEKPFLKTSYSQVSRYLINQHR